MVKVIGRVRGVQDVINIYTHTPRREWKEGEKGGCVRRVCREDG